MGARGWSVGMVCMLLIARSASAETSTKRPAELLAIVAIGPDSAYRNLFAYADAIDPGSLGTFREDVWRYIIAQTVGASSLAGLGPTSRMSLLIADIDGKWSFALLAPVVDPQLVVRDGGAAGVSLDAHWAVLGSPNVRQRLAPYALATIARRPAVITPTMSIYLPGILALYRRELSKIQSLVIGGFSLPILEQVIPAVTKVGEGLQSLVDEAEELAVALDVTPQICTFELTLRPRPGSRLAAFAATQRPTDYALLARLPPIRAPLIFAGLVALGPYRESSDALSTMLYGANAGPAWRAAKRSLEKVLTGELVSMMQITPAFSLEDTQLFGVSDVAAADRAIAAMLAPFTAGETVETAGVSSTLMASSTVTRYGGVALHKFDVTFDASKVPPLQRSGLDRTLQMMHGRVYLAAFDGVGVWTHGWNSLAEARHAIDAVRGAPHFVASEVTDRLLARSRARRDSFAFVLDVPVFMSELRGRPVTVGQTALLSFGFSGKVVRIHLDLPAAAIREIRNAFSS